jgi:hypothetical protein
MSLQKVFELYPEIYAQLFREGVEQAELLKEKR